MMRQQIKSLAFNSAIQVFDETDKLSCKTTRQLMNVFPMSFFCGLFYDAVSRKIRPL
jgi:hypothetical protein